MSTECGDADLDLRAVTIRNPWAECIARGVKPVENRVRPTKYRGLVAIHTALRDDLHAWRDPRIGAALDDLRDDDFGRRIFRRRSEDGCVYGAIIAVATLADCHYGQGCCGEWADRGQYHLALTDVRRLPEPIPARGSLALPWRVPADVAEQVWAQVPDLAVAP